MINSGVDLHFWMLVPGVIGAGGNCCYFSFFLIGPMEQIAPEDIDCFYRLGIKLKLRVSCHLFLIIIEKANTDLVKNSGCN